jgi:hypothetical protein
LAVPHRLLLHACPIDDGTHLLGARNDPQTNMTLRAISGGGPGLMEAANRRASVLQAYGGRIG